MVLTVPRNFFNKSAVASTGGFMTAVLRMYHAALASWAALVVVFASGVFPAICSPV